MLENLTEQAKVKLEKRFWSKVDKNGPIIREDLGPCWVWTRCKREGYGAFSVSLKSENHLVGAHIIAYELAHGPVPKGCWILHQCDNRACVRHIEAGSQSKNLKDCIARGRHNPPKGERNGMSILTSEKVAEIRSSYDGKIGSMTRLSERFGVGVPAIHGIIRGRSWK